jgi:hypothetical protein
LSFGLLYDDFCGVVLMHVYARETWVIDGVLSIGFLLFRGLAGLGDATDKADEAVPIALGGYGRDLRFLVHHAFEEVLCPFDQRILGKRSVLA